MPIQVHDKSKKPSTHGKLWGTDVTPDWHRTVRGGLYEVESGGWRWLSRSEMSYETWTHTEQSGYAGAKHL
jgi:hypothetical protein